MKNKNKTRLDLNEEIEKIFPKMTCMAADFDYSIIEKHRHEWETISRIGQCAVFVFDCFTHKFVYVSDIALDLFGLSADAFLEKGHDPGFDLVHPDDIEYLILTRKKVYHLLESLPKEEIKDYKLVHEFRLRNLKGEYVRITEQEQVVEFNNDGKIWLTLSIFNVDAGNTDHPIKSHIYNLKKGEQIFIDLSDSLEEPLTLREKKILQCIRQGLMSKEIADYLGISINTVHVHRQNLFNKLGVENAMEAVNVALKLGLFN